MRLKLQNHPDPRYHSVCINLLRRHVLSLSTCRTTWLFAVTAARPCMHRPIKQDQHQETMFDMYTFRMTSSLAVKLTNDDMLSTQVSKSLSNDNCDVKILQCLNTLMANGCKITLVSDILVVRLPSSRFYP